jgi:E2/UBC family protein E
MDLLSEHFERLRKQHDGATIKNRADGSALVTVPNVRLPAGWNAESTTVHFVVPVGYPAARLDCFWTDPNLRLASGMLPTNSQINASYGGPEPLLWFSYHPTSWNPLRDDLLTYLKIATTRFRDTR